MKKFIGKRLLLSIISLWVIISVTFIMMHSVPGNPFSKEGRMSQAVYESLTTRYGLDKPLSQQYLIYLKNIARGDLGDSMYSNSETVNDMIKRGAPVSARLGLQAFLIAMIIGPLLGSIAALYQNKVPDYIMMIVALIGISVPSFILATLFIKFIAQDSGYFPIGGWGSFKHTVLPSLALSFMPMAASARLMRSSMLEVLGQDYVKTAKSKGISRFRVIISHAVRNAILPIVSTMGTSLAGLITGSFVIEKIFGIPGLGSFFVTSIGNRDYTLIMGTTIFYSFILIILLLLVDILYGIIDPRIDIAE